MIGGERGKGGGAEREAWAKGRSLCFGERAQAPILCLL